MFTSSVSVWLLGVSDKNWFWDAESSESSPLQHRHHQPGWQVCGGHSQPRDQLRRQVWINLWHGDQQLSAPLPGSVVSRKIFQPKIFLSRSWIRLWWLWNHQVCDQHWNTHLHCEQVRKGSFIIIDSRLQNVTTPLPIHFSYPNMCPKKFIWCQILEHADHSDSLQCCDTPHCRAWLQTIPHRSHWNRPELQLCQHKLPSVSWWNQQWNIQHLHQELILITKWWCHR